MTVTSWTGRLWPVTILGGEGGCSGLFHLHSHKEQSAVQCPCFPGTAPCFPGTASSWHPDASPLFWLTQKTGLEKNSESPLQPETTLFKSECQGWVSWGSCVCRRHSGCAQALHLGIWQTQARRKGSGRAGKALVLRAGLHFPSASSAKRKQE